MDATEMLALIAHHIRNNFAQISEVLDIWMIQC